MGEFFGSIYCWFEDFFGLEPLHLLDNSKLKKVNENKIFIINILKYLKLTNVQGKMRNM